MRPAHLHSPALSRRALLKGIAGVGAIAFVPWPAFPASGDSNPIRTENAKRGTRDWLLQKTRIDPPTKYRCPLIEGYCSRTSLRPGEKITRNILDRMRQGKGA